MKLKSTSGYVFEANDEAAKELLERGDYVKAGEKEESATVAEPTIPAPPKKSRRRKV